MPIKHKEVTSKTLEMFLPNVLSSNLYKMLGLIFLHVWSEYFY